MCVNSWANPRQPWKSRTHSLSINGCHELKGGRGEGPGHRGRPSRRSSSSWCPWSTSATWRRALGWDPTLNRTESAGNVAENKTSGRSKEVMGEALERQGSRAVEPERGRHPPRSTGGRSVQPTPPSAPRRWRSDSEKGVCNFDIQGGMDGRQEIKCFLLFLLIRILCWLTINARLFEVVIIFSSSCFGQLNCKSWEIIENSNDFGRETEFNEVNIAKSWNIAWFDCKPQKHLMWEKVPVAEQLVCSYWYGAFQNKLTKMEHSH